MTDLQIKKSLLSCPGDSIQEHIDHIGMSQAELAERLSISIPNLSELIKGKSPITKETATKLEYVLGVPTSFWLNLERTYHGELLEIEQVIEITTPTINIITSRDFAIKAHKNKYGDKPYVFHLDMVYDVANNSNTSEDVKIACYLHDVLEDTSVSYKSLLMSFGINIANLVWLVSDEQGETRNIRKLKTYKKLKGNHEAIILKLCDRIANIHYSMESGSEKKLLMYLEESIFKAELFDIDYYKEELCNVYINLWDKYDALIEIANICLSPTK